MYIDFKLNVHFVNCKKCVRRDSKKNSLSYMYAQKCYIELMQYKNTNFTYET